jgi:hypothetical protein
MAISLGALLADVPHSRPVPLIGTATDDRLIERFELRRSQYEGRPASSGCCTTT